MGEGSGAYPTCDPFAYEETVAFAHINKPFLVYTQRTKGVPEGQPMHAESGYWRMPQPPAVEVVISHPNGLVEISEGTLDGSTFRLASTLVGRTSTAKEVTAIEREVTVEGDVLRYELRMAAMGEPMGFHLEAELHRAP